MKTMVAVCAVMVLGAGSAGAVDINGKWGIGAGVFGGGGEVSLIRGKSERSAWLFDVGVKQRDEAYDTEVTPPLLPTTSSRSIVTVEAGPGYRRYVRGTEDFSPYWDLQTHGLYTRVRYDNGSSDKQTSAGAEGIFSFGLEYFTRWHFSVAAHSTVAQISWVQVSRRQFSGGGETRTTGHLEDASIQLRPVLFVRGYW